MDRKMKQNGGSKWVYLKRINIKIPETRIKRIKEGFGMKGKLLQKLKKNGN